jgi:hypothetical protein
MDSHCGPLCFSESGPTDSHCGLKLYCTVLRYCMVPVVRSTAVRSTYRYSRAKSGAADSDCGVKLGAENSLSGFNHCVSTSGSSKTTVPASLTVRLYSTTVVRALQLARRAYGLETQSTGTQDTGVLCSVFFGSSSQLARDWHGRNRPIIGHCSGGTRNTEVPRDTELGTRGSRGVPLVQAAGGLPPSPATPLAWAWDQAGSRGSGHRPNTAHGLHAGQGGGRAADTGCRGVRSTARAEGRGFAGAGADGSGLGTGEGGSFGTRGGGGGTCRNDDVRYGEAARRTGSQPWYHTRLTNGGC